jgi:hypothetical protein
MTDFNDDDEKGDQGGATAALIRYGEGDPFTEYADAVAPAHRGKLFKFSKGSFYAGESNDQVPLGTKFVANIDELLVGWLRWENGRPVEHRMGRVADKWRAPPRSELGHHEQALWDVGADGKPADPWQFVNYLPLMDERGEIFTFTTSSRGGLSAIGTLSGQYGRQRAKHPDEFPVITLGANSYQHQVKSYGRIQYPEFHLIMWWPKSLFGVPPGEEGFTLPPLKDELNDDIPFFG